MTRPGKRSGERRPGQRPLHSGEQLGTFLMSRHRVDAVELAEVNGAAETRMLAVIDRADPEVWVHPSLIDKLTADHDRVETSDGCALAFNRDALFAINQALLTIVDSRGRAVVYRVDLEPVDGLAGPLYYACWPD